MLLEILPQLKSAEHKCCDRQDQTIALSKVRILQTRSTVWRLSPPQTRATSPRTSSSSSSSCRCWWRWWQYSCWPSISTAARPNTPPVRWAPPRCFVTVNCWTTSWTTGRPVPRHLTAPWPRPLLTQPTPCLPPTRGRSTLSPPLPSPTRGGLSTESTGESSPVPPVTSWLGPLASPQQFTRDQNLHLITGLWCSQLRERGRGREGEGGYDRSVTRAEFTGGLTYLSSHSAHWSPPGKIGEQQLVGAA